MTHYLGLTTIIAFTCISVTAQVTLPPVDRFHKEISAVDVIGPYTPTGTFAKKFPNFMKDGKYRLDYTYPNWNNTTNYSSDKVPAILVPFSGKTEKFDMAVATFTSYNNTFNPRQGNGGDGWSDGLIAYARQKYRQHDDDGKRERDLVEEYTTRTQSFSHATDSILKTLGTVNNSFADIGLNDYRNIHVTPGAVLLYFRQERMLMLTRKMTDDYPEYVYYTLTVRNAFGEIYKTYHQLVMLDADEGKYAINNYPTWVAYGFFVSTYKGGIQGLLYQFFNDKATVNAIRNDIQAVKQKIATDPSYAQLVDARIKYAAMKAYLADIATVSLSVTGSYNRYSSGIAANNTYNTGYMANNSISAAANNTFSAGANATAGLINNAFAQAEARENNRLQAALNREGSEYDAQMAELSAEIAALPPSPDKDKLVQQVQQDHTDLTGALAQAMAARNEAAKATDASRKRAAEGMQQLGSAAHQWNNSVHPESAAITSAKDPNSPEAKQCAQEATNQWKSDPRYNQLSNSGQQADLDELKAIMTDIMIEHCGDFMSPQDKAQYKSIADQARQEAAQLRAGRFNYKK